MCPRIYIHTQRHAHAHASSFMLLCIHVGISNCCLLQAMKRECARVICQYCACALSGQRSLHRSPKLSLACNIWHVVLLVFFLIVVSVRSSISRSGRRKVHTKSATLSTLRNQFKGAELIDSVLDVVRKEAEGDGSWASSISEHILRLACSEHSV